MLGCRLCREEPRGWSQHSPANAPRPCAEAQGPPRCPPGEPGLCRCRMDFSRLIGGLGAQRGLFSHFLPCSCDAFPSAPPAYPEGGGLRRGGGGLRGSRESKRCRRQSGNGAGPAFSEGGLVPARGGPPARPPPRDPARPPPARARHRLRRSPTMAACERRPHGLRPHGRTAA